MWSNACRVQRAVAIGQTPAEEISNHDHTIRHLWNIDEETEVKMKTPKVKKRGIYSIRIIVYSSLTP